MRFTQHELVIAAFLDGIIFFDYFMHAIHAQPHSLLRFIENIPINTNIYLFGIGAILCGFGFLFAANFAPYIYSLFQEIKTAALANKKQFFILFSIYAISSISLIRANFYFQDDIGRAVSGFGITGGYSRHIANIFSEFLHGNSWLADVAPLPQIVALALMALSATLLLHIVSQITKATPHAWSFIPLIPVGLSPYFLSCLSYRYDAADMALSVFVSIVPALFYKRKGASYPLIVFFATILMTTTYQASSGIFPIIVFIMSLLMWIQKYQLKDIFTFVGISAAAYIAGLLAFKMFIMAPVTTNFVEVSASPLYLVPNITKYITLVHTDFPFLWKALIVVVFICFIFYTIKASKQNKFLTALVSVAISLLTAILTFGIYLIFEQPLIFPRAFYGIGIYITLLSLPIMLAEKHLLGKIASTVLSWLFISYAFIYGNALSMQNEYTDFRIQAAINDLDDLGMLSTDSELNIRAKGSAGHPRALYNIANEYPIIKREIVAQPESHDVNPWGMYKFENFYGLHTKDEVENADVENLVPIKSSYYHDIYQLENGDVIIDFKNAEKYDIKK